MKLRICDFPKCGTILSKDNKGKFCCLHHRILIQNEVEYGKRGFFQRFKLKKIPLPIFKVKGLKEIATIEDYLFTDRL